MGGQQSKGTSRIGDTRGRWVKATDVFDSRVPPIAEEEKLRRYYQCYIKRCEMITDSYDFNPNEEYQSILDGVDEDLQQKTVETHELVAKHHHNIIGMAVDIIDDVGESSSAGSSKMVDALPGAGTAYISNGFFFFHWADYLGEKFGRSELRVCRKLSELHQTVIHVPLTYHVVYKGQAVTVQALTPISTSTRVDVSESDELISGTKEILDCFNLKPFEVFGASHTIPPDVEIHEGRDGRYYSICNYQWFPPWPKTKGDRYEISQRFSCFRPELLIAQPTTISCRAFHVSAFVTDNTTALQLTRLLIDQFIHDVPKIVGTVNDRGSNTILVHFRQCGFNYSCLGLLLLSLLRNISPPKATVRTVVSELLARGMKHFICMKVAGEPSKDDEYDQENGPAKTTTTTNRGGADAGEGIGGGADHSEFGFGAIDMFNAGSNDTNDHHRNHHHDDARLDGSMSMTVMGTGGADLDALKRHDVVANRKATSRPHFLQFVETVLSAFLEYKGAPVPRPATLFQAAVYPPNDLFGGEVLPIIYKKFRLLPADVDLYGEIPQTQKYDIYNRVCQLLGVQIKDGAVAQVLPILVKPSTPAMGVPMWIERRLEVLGKKLFTGAPLRSMWLHQGSATILLLRHQPAYWDFYDVVQQYMETLTPKNHLWHTYQASMKRELLDVVVEERKAALASASTADKVLLINLMRKQAFAAFDEDCLTEAREIIEEVILLATAVLEEFGNAFAPQYRRCCSEAVLYIKDEDDCGDVEATMLRNVARYCKPDTLVAQDYLQMGVVQANLGSLSEAVQHLQKARRTFIATVGENNIKTHRTEANLAAVLMMCGEKGNAMNVLRELLQRNTLLRDVIESAGVHLSDVAPTEILSAITHLQKEEVQVDADQEPFLFIPHNQLYQR